MYERNGQISLAQYSLDVGQGVGIWRGDVDEEDVEVGMLMVEEESMKEEE